MQPNPARLTRKQPSPDSVVFRLHAHLSGDGTYNDSETADLYAESHGLDDADCVDSDDIAKWAVETAQAYALRYSKPLGTPATQPE